MDFGFINSIMRTKFMPPQDMWLAGQSINYYYYGQYFTAFLTKLSGLNTAYTFNLMIATIFAFAFSLTFSLTSNLLFITYKKKIPSIIGGFLSGFFIILAGNLHAVIYGVILPFLQKINLYHGYQPTYYYADATRFIGYNPSTDDKTIHEFPSYSFIISDLHAHLLDLPFVILAIALIYLIISTKNIKHKIISGIILSVVLATTFMTNTWDTPVLVALTLAAAIPSLFQILSSRPQWRDRPFASPLFYIQNSLFKSLATSALPLMLTAIVLSLAFISPFLAKFQNFSQGFMLAPHHTPIYQYLVLWAFPIICSIVYFVIYFKTKKTKNDTDVAITKKFILLLTICAICVTLVPEIISIKDIYSPEYARANTMFKFAFEAFIIFSIPVGFTMIAVWLDIKKRFFKYFIAIFLGLIFLCGFVFVFKAIPGYYKKNQQDFQFQSLNGTKYLEQTNPEDYALINYLNTLKDQPVIAEAYGDSYSEFARRSSYTGLPTPLGWYIHEFLWHSNNQDLIQRQSDIDNLYTSKDINITKELIKKYNIKYIVIGQLEFQKYPDLNQNNLIKSGKTVFEQGATKLIKIDP